MIRRAFVCFVLLMAASRAEAQFKVPEPGAGEQYRVEFTLRFWSPTPELTLSTGGLASLGIGPVDFVETFNLANDRFTEYRVTSKAGKHKFLYGSIPISYSTSEVVTRTVTFGGVTIPVSALATTEIDWRIRRYGYEWDFVSASRGYLGVLADVKDNSLSASVSAGPYGSEEAEVRVWIPTIGAGARVYPHRLVSVTGEFGVELTRFKGFDRLKRDWDGRYVDYDIYGTMNFGRHFALQGGYRSMRIDYESDSDTANLRMNGYYWGGNVRF